MAKRGPRRREECDPVARLRALGCTTTSQECTKVHCINLIVANRLDVSTILSLFNILIVASLTLTLGFFSRLSALVVFVLLCSFDHRNLFVLNGGDVLMRITAFYLML